MLFIRHYIAGNTLLADACLSMLCQLHPLLHILYMQIYTYIYIYMCINFMGHIWKVVYKKVPMHEVLGSKTI
jgi:hypothetical protein